MKDLQETVRIHPGSAWNTRAGILIAKMWASEHSLDSGSRSAKRSSSGMTGSAKCDIVSKARRFLRS